MKNRNDLQVLFGWIASLNRPEEGCESLIEWLEIEEKAVWKRAGQAALVSGVFSLICMLVGAVVFGRADYFMGLDSPGALAGGAIFAVGAMGGLVAKFIARRHRQKSPPRRDPDALRMIEKLNEAREHRKLRRKLGEHGALELNEGASLLLRCRSILTSEAWVSGSPEDPWLEARDGMIRAMELAMDRLTVFVVRKRPFAEIVPVLDEMRTATNEAARIAEHRSSLAGSAGHDLRASLARMKELAAAEEELLDLSLPK